ncbi:MAG: hypothetical protein CMP54_02980 [Flavobacteriales bacterium]|nr:hypothetical protein [Flavobacteriales bacterium]
MNKKQSLKIVGLIFIILVSALIIQNHSNEEEIGLNNKKNTTSIINCSPINLTSISPLIEVSGRIQSADKINIISEVNGISESYNSKFEVGEFFKQGEVLISIKDNDIELELKSIKSQFLALLVQVLPDIKMDFPQLGNKFQEYINNISLDRKLSQLPKPGNTKERNFLSSRQVFANYYTIKALENKLDKFKIKAPFDGVVTKALIDVGSNIIVGQPIGEFINPYKYEINTSVSVRESLLINQGDRVIINSDDLNNSIEGIVTRKGMHINELTQSIDVFIAINDVNLKDGMYATAQIICDSINNVFKIERTKLLSNNSIYLIDSNNLKLREIDVIAFQNDSIIISGLDNNDCIANEYRQYFYDGMPIK